MARTAAEIFADIKADAIARGVYTPTREGDFVLAEKLLGFTLPPLVREMYATCGNGGFGPEMRPLVRAADETSRGKNPFTSQLEEPHSVVFTYRPSPPPYAWPKGVLPICDQGCNIESCIDLRDPGLPVLRFEQGFTAEDEEQDATCKAKDPFEPECGSVVEWLELWLAKKRLAVAKRESSGPPHRGQ